MTAAGSPRLKAPPGTCDCHMHIYDPRFSAAPTWPLVLPNAPLPAYRAVQAALGLSRAIIVQPNGYKFDNACTEESVRALGSSARGIATIPVDIPDAEIERLTRVGFRGARCSRYNSSLGDGSSRSAPRQLQSRNSRSRSGAGAETCVKGRTRNHKAATAASRQFRPRFRRCAG